LRNPPQFTAYFEEHEYAPSLRMSRYQVYYHLAAGDGGNYGSENSNLKYSVYLKGGGLPVFYVVRPTNLAVNDFADESIDRIAPSGYSEICVNMNGREYCGVGKIVSSSFGVSQVANYLVQHDLSKNIDSEEECRGETSGYIPNVVIERRCSVENPGRGLGAENERAWAEVGECGENHGRCWLNLGSLDDSDAQRKVYYNLCEDAGEICYPSQKCVGGSSDDNVVTDPAPFETVKFPETVKLPIFVSFPVE